MNERLEERLIRAPESLTTRQQEWLSTYNTTHKPRVLELTREYLRSQARIITYKDAKIRQNSPYS